MYSISPLPIRCSAPLCFSPITLLSTSDASWKVILVGKLAFITPETTSTDGLCVATTRCIPAALAFCANLCRYISKSLPSFPLIALIKSASSSITITIYGNFSEAVWLYSSRFRTPASAILRYRLSISLTAQCNEGPARLYSVITGVSRCGMLL